MQFALAGSEDVEEVIRDTNHGGRKKSHDVR